MRRVLSVFVVVLVGIALLSQAACTKIPEASFSASTTSGPAPLTVNFVDQSLNEPTQWQWDFGDGTSSEQNPTHAYTKADTYTVKFTATNEKGSSTAQPIQVTVTPGTLDRVTLEPDSATLSLEGEQKFTATAFDAHGNEITWASFKWTATPAAGSVFAEGRFTASTKAGSYKAAIKVEATHEGVTRSATAPVTILPGPLDKVVLSPDSATLGPGETQTFTFQALDAHDNQIADFQTAWKVANEGGTINNEGVFTADTKAGTYEQTVQVEVIKDGTTHSATASITVHPGPLDRVVLTPDSTTLGPGETQSFTVQALDAHDNEITGAQTSWKVAKGGGAITDEGAFTAGAKMGTYGQTVQVKVTKDDASFSATASITIVPGPVDRVVVSPDSAELDIGGSQGFQATGFDHFDNEIADLTFKWSTTAGEIDPEGQFTTGTRAGAFSEGVKAEATYRDSTVVSAAAITIRPDPLDSVSVEPATATLAIQSTQRFTARALDQYGNEIPGITPNWTLTGGGGTIGNNGLFTAGTVAGSYEDTVVVRVTQGDTDREATASVVVNPGPLDQIALAPTSGDIGMGMQQQFVAAGADRFGNRISGLTFTWSVEAGGGTIDASGLFTAGSQPGTYSKTVTATATHEDITGSRTASVTVQPDRIAFLSDHSDDQFDIYTIDVDGENEERLTTSAESEGRPSWSPDGRRIVYSDYAAGDIIAMSDDGTWKVALLSGQGAYEPVWSPSGSKIAFQSWADGDGEICVMDADGGNVTCLTDNEDYEDYPTWSPDGQKIAFVSDRDGNDEIYVMSADGSGQRRLTSNSIITDTHPAWSPGGTEIAYESGTPGGYWHIKVMNADGTNVRMLTPQTYGSGMPSWSPDGSKIVFHSWRDADTAEIYIMNRDGSNVTRLTTNEASDGLPRWAPRKRGVEVSQASVVIPRSSALKDMTVQEVTAQASKAVVRMVTDLGSGSGFIIDPNGFILTNNHVISDAEEITVYLADGTEYAGAVMGRDLVRDLAVVKIEASDLPYLEMGDLGEVGLGSEAVVIGYPLGFEEVSVTRGLVSAIKTDEGRNISWVQTDSAINPGNSGGPILNLQGQVIGVVAIKYAGIGLEGLGFGISANTVNLYLERLKAGEVITS